MRILKRYIDKLIDSKIKPLKSNHNIVEKELSEIVLKMKEQSERFKEMVLLGIEENATFFLNKKVNVHYTETRYHNGHIKYQHHLEVNDVYLAKIENRMNYKDGSINLWLTKDLCSAEYNIASVKSISGYKIKEVKNETN